MKEGSSSKQNVGFLSLLSFWWMQEIMSKGNKTSLSEHDLLPITDEQKSKKLVEELERDWSQEVSRCRRKGTKPQLWKSLLRIISWKEWAYVLTLRITQSTAYVLLSVLLWFFLKTLTNTTKIDYKSTFLLVVAFLVTTVWIAISTSHWIFRTYVWGIRWKIATIGLIYKKIVAMKRSHLNEVLSGNTLNLAANDALRLEQAALYLVYPLTATLEAIAGAILLGYMIGWEGVAGSSFMLLLVVYILVMARKISILRQKAAVVTDQRLSVMNEIISGIRTLKMYTWEENYLSLIQSLRRKEIRFMHFKAAITATLYGLYNTGTHISGIIAVSLLLIGGKEINTSMLFTMLSMIELIKFALGLCFVDCALYLTEVHVGLRRMENFLLQADATDIYGEQQQQHKETNASNIANSKATSTLPVYFRGRTYRTDAIRQESMQRYKPVLLSFCRLPSFSHSKPMHLSLDSICCSWSKDNARTTLNKVSLKLQGGKLVVITGPVGSGKSSLLMAILQELPISSGQISSTFRCAFVSQIPWVFSGTFRENVLFGRPFNESKYNSVLEACDLLKDISTFPKGDLTNIGERGVSLSGGQRARVSLARAVYSEADVYLLDDPLSAVDAQVGKQIFEKCICGMLSGRLRILTTHQLQYLKMADHVVILRDGEVTQQGPHAQIRDVEVTPVRPHRPGVSCEASFSGDDRTFCNESLKDLEGEDEDRMTGSVSWRMYWTYLRAGLPAFLVVFFIALLIIVQVSILSPHLWLSHMIGMSREQQTATTTLTIYGLLVAGCLVITVSGGFSVLYVTLKSSQKLHDRMASIVIKAPVLFFDINPCGRILNRFSKDIGSMDVLLPMYGLQSEHYILLAVCALLLPVATNFWVLFALVPFTICASIITRFFLRTSRELKRLEATRCSPVYSHFAETVRGLEIIHSSDMESEFLERFYRHQDENTEALYMVYAGGAWFGIRLDLLCSFFVTAVAVAAVLAFQNPVTVGLSLTYCMHSMILLMYGVKMFAQMENHMTSAERVMTYTELDPEPGYHVRVEPPDTWPEQGTLEVKDVSLRYVEGGPRVLKDLSFSIKAGEKIGVAGRTGAGKSSMVAALFRMPEPKGKVIIDGVEMGTLNLQAARRAIAVITQDPVLFGGSLRKNLDPFSHFSDADLWATLGEVQLKRLVEKLPGQLEFQVRESGANFSVGERQLVCLARALLHRTKIVIMDEATANVDFKTDHVIQEVIRNKCQDSTVMTIAHRLNTIIDYDKVLVLDGGRVVEYDKPEVLLAKRDGALARLLQAHACI